MATLAAYPAMMQRDRKREGLGSVAPRGWSESAFGSIGRSKPEIARRTWILTNGSASCTGGRRRSWVVRGAKVRESVFASFGQGRP